jgi:hypothetical protein
MTQALHFYFRDDPLGPKDERFLGCRCELLMAPMRTFPLRNFWRIVVADTHLSTRLSWQF